MRDLTEADGVLLEYAAPHSMIDMGNLFFAATEYQMAMDEAKAEILNLESLLSYAEGEATSQGLTYRDGLEREYKSRIDRLLRDRDHLQRCLNDAGYARDSYRQALEKAEAEIASWKFCEAQNTVSKALKPTCPTTPGHICEKCDGSKNES